MRLISGGRVTVSQGRGGIFIQKRGKEEEEEEEEEEKRCVSTQIIEWKIFTLSKLKTPSTFSFVAS